MKITFNAWRDTVHPLAGGSEVMIDRLATGLTERGHQVTLCAGTPITDHPYPVLESGSRFGQYLRSPYLYARHFRDADLVVDVANGMSFYTPLWRKEPVICFVHHVHTAQWSQWFPGPVAALGRGLEGRAMPAAYANCIFVTVSQSSAEALVDLGIEREHIRIVHNGVDLPDDVPAKSPEPTFVALGRLVPHKRYDLLARVWKRVQPVTGGRLLILGEGPEADRIAAIGAPALELVGRVSDAERDRLLGEAWLLVHPSMLEGWGLVVMEAAARGTPTLGFDAPGVRDSVVHNVTGVLAQSETELAQEWIRLATETELRTKLGEEARIRAESFSWERTVDRFEEVAEEAVLAGRRPPRGRPMHLHPTTPSAGAGAGDAVRPVPADPLPSKAELFRLFLNEKTDPDPFYSRLAQRSIAEFSHDVAGRLVLDLGCGHGYDTKALRDAGATVVPVDLNPAKLIATGELLDGSVQGDAWKLPFPDATFDGVYCSNLLEHTPATAPVLAEIQRVLKLGGWAWVSWTNWYSPWGGHEIVPLHMLGPDRGYRAWVKLFGEPRINAPYKGLWPTYIGTVLDQVDRQAGLRLTDASPRYWPSQRWILKVPGLREVATWNCVLELERVSEPPR